VVTTLTVNQSQVSLEYQMRTKILLLPRFALWLLICLLGLSCSHGDGSICIRLAAVVTGPNRSAEPGIEIWFADNVATYTSLRNSPICLTDSRGVCVTTVRYRFAVDEWPWTKLFRPKRFELVLKKQGKIVRRLNLDDSLNRLQFQCYQDVRLKIRV